MPAMVIYKDLIENLEVISKAYIAKETELFFECKARLITGDVEDVNDPNVEKVVDIAYKQGLDKIDDFSKASFMSCMKAMAKAALKALKKAGKTEEELKEW